MSYDPHQLQNFQRLLKPGNAGNFNSSYVPQLDAERDSKLLSRGRISARSAGIVLQEVRITYQVRRFSHIS